MIKKLFLDTENTTAEIGDGHIIEIGGIIEYGKTYKEFVLNAQPADFEYVLKEEATDKHGFSREDIDKFPTCQQAYSSLIEILEKHVDRYDKTDKFVMYGYGAEFDNQFLRKFFLENNDNFFGSWFDIEGKKQTGYYLGHQIVKSWEKEENFKKIAIMKMNEIDEKVKKSLEVFSSYNDN